MTIEIDWKPPVHPKEIRERRAKRTEHRQHLAVELINRRLHGYDGRENIYCIKREDIMGSRAAGYDLDLEALAKVFRGVGWTVIVERPSLTRSKDIISFLMHADE